MVPAATGADNRLAVPSTESSSVATLVSADTDDPVYTPSTVSNELPFVFTLRVPELDGTNEYQRVEAADPAEIGSPVSRVAVELVS